MTTATIYATATHKQKDNYGIFGITILNPKAKKSIEKTGDFDSESKIETQISTLIHSLSFLNTKVEIDEVVLHTDFALVKNFLDGTVIEWESNNWVKSNEKAVPHANLWQELSDLCVQHNIKFILADGNDETIADLSKKAKSGIRKVAKPSKNKVVTAKEKSNITKMPAPKTKKLPKEKPPVNEAPEEEEKEAVFEEETPEVLPNQLTFDEVLPEASTPVVEGPVNISKTTSSTNSISVDETLKEECDALFEQIGLDVDTAVTIFLKHSLRKQGLTLDLKLSD